MITLPKALAFNGPARPRRTGSRPADGFTVLPVASGRFQAGLPAPALIDRAHRCQGDCPCGGRCRRPSRAGFAPSPVPPTQASTRPRERISALLPLCGVNREAAACTVSRRERVATRACPRVSHIGPWGIKKLFSTERIAGIALWTSTVFNGGRTAGDRHCRIQAASFEAR